MILNTTQRESFNVATQPLMQWLRENCHPHVVVIVEPTRAELTEGVYMSFSKQGEEKETGA